MGRGGTIRGSGRGAVRDLGRNGGAGHGAVPGVAPGGVPGGMSGAMPGVMPGVWPDARGAGVADGVGAARHHDSAHLHVSGRAVYVDDIRTAGDAAIVLIGQSPHAHARIKSMRLDDARAHEGVFAVLTHKDIPGVNDCSPVHGDDPVFASDVVSYLGQAVFAIVARSMRDAREALGRARVEYEPLAAILDIDTAMREASWLGPPAVMECGDADGALAVAQGQVSGRIEIGGQEHFYLEGQAALAVPDEDGNLGVYCSTQHPSEIQHKVADCLGMRSHQITVETRRMGGAFGGKESQGNLPAIVSALAARATGMPAKTVYDRDDDFMLTGKRHDFRIDYSAGFDDEGRISSVVFDQAVRCGMSWDLSQAVALRAMCHADNAYHIPNMRITSHRCRTNTQSNTAFRGFGGPQGILGMERVIDHVAHELGMDPFEVRRRNFYPPTGVGGAGGVGGADGGASGVGRQGAGIFGRASTLAVGPEMRDGVALTPYGQPVEDCHLEEISRELASDCDYRGRRKRIEAFNRKSRVLKRGIALTPVKFGISFNTTFLNQAGALVHVYTDGSVTLNHGGTEMGQGLNTKVAQIVATEFGIDFDAVMITATDTSKVPNTSATAASSGTDLNGMAARAAARTIKTRMATFLAARHGCEIDEVAFTPAGVRVAGRVLGFAAAARICHMGRVQLSATGFHATPKISWDGEAGRGSPFLYFACGAAVSEVIVDLMTGENRILRTDILHDVGHSINPAIDIGQIEGGFVQGAGWLTTEELVWDDKGRLLTHAPSTYKIPACGDRPQTFNVKLFERGTRPGDTPHGSKAVGEPPLMLSVSVFMALSHALGGIAGYGGGDDNGGDDGGGYGGAGAGRGHGGIAGTGGIGRAGVGGRASAVGGAGGNGPIRGGGAKGEYPALSAPATPERLCIRARDLGGPGYRASDREVLS